MPRQLAIDALQMALGRRRPWKGLLHHSDRGTQYASVDYQKILKEHGITYGMSGKGNCYDNAVAESMFRGLKSEWGNHYRWYISRAEAIPSLFYYIEIFYNRKRRHSSVDYTTPQDYSALSLSA